LAKYTQADVESVAAVMKSARDTTGTPFALLTGAGCSKGAGIPLAAELMKTIEEKLPHRLLGVDAEKRASYGYCMGCLPEAEQKFILQPFLDTSKVNWAHIAIAGMMNAGFVARVLTFNFDNVLARACGLCGLYPPIYDFAVAPSDTTSHIGANAIVHLHGQGHGFSMFNSEKKTREHAQRLHPLLADSFDRFPFLVMGYSGDSDAIFPEISEIYYGRHDLIWAGYAEEPSAAVSGFLAKADRVARYVGGADADRFLVAIARELDCMPKLFTDPYGHLLDELVPVTDFPVDEHSDSNLLLDLREELQEAQRQKLAKGENTSDLFRAGNWQAVLSRFDPTDPEQVDLAYWSAIALGTAAFERGRGRREPADFHEAIIHFSRATELRPDRPEALSNWGSALGTLGERTGDVRYYEQAFERYRQSNEIKEGASTLKNWGLALKRLADIKGEADLYHKSIEKCKLASKLNPNDHGILKNLASAFRGLARLTGDESYFEQAIDTYYIASKIKPDDGIVYNNCGGALLEIWRITRDDARLVEAERMATRAQELLGESNYNLGCVLAVRDDVDRAKAQLLRCEKDGTLPTAEHLESDVDLIALRDADWFKDMVERARERPVPERAEAGDK